MHQPSDLKLLERFDDFLVTHSPKSRISFQRYCSAERPLVRLARFREVKQMREWLRRLFARDPRNEAEELADHYILVAKQVGAKAARGNGDMHGAPCDERRVGPILRSVASPLVLAC